MNCQVFEKRLMDLIEDNVAYDLKDAMMEHTTKCEHCRELYEKEMAVENTLKNGLGAEGIYFNSSRGDIMKNIDKNRYSKNPLKKLNYHIKKYSGLYAAAAVLIISTSFIVPYIFGGSSKKDTASSKMSTESKSIVSSDQSLNIKEDKQSTAKNEESAAPKNSVEEKKSSIVIPEDKNAPVFKKTALLKTVEPSFNTPIQTSPNKKFEATVEGKGDAAQEEGIAKLFIKDLTTGGRWTFEMVQDPQKGQQNTPKYVKWVDDNNFLTIVGSGYGTVTRGGSLYLMNAETGKLVNADIERKIDLSQGKVEITKVLTIRSNELDVEVNVYEDDNLMKSHIEKRTISFPYADLKQYIEAAQ